MLPFSVMNTPVTDDSGKRPTEVAKKPERGGKMLTLLQISQKLVPAERLERQPQ